ncbi:uncharacterized protein LY89DRAFT_728021 [Mollisia scopiformis]|uniref:F-box domain-containing protein n=1 Tax=Mollisia scopiformis TaxID=149040 RepID=A0A194XSS9_MOLSC|nr:uncharacterized protein LY89DRAFT_728021 [Mollisia scopiformis]KUJ23253.1 hypothetical protein LY89DRAFT_728021 [Mollisia scopiformis]
MANTLNGLPNEILHNIFKYLDPRDLGRIFRVSKQLKKFMTDKVLFKEVYCYLLDGPVNAFKPAGFDYKEELIKFCIARRILQSDKKVEDKRNDIVQISKYLTEACYISTPKESQTIQRMKNWFDDNRGYPRKQRDNIEAFLCQSSTFFRARHIENTLPNLTLEERQASAKLHVFYGVPLFLPRTRKWHTTYPYAVSVVYDLRNYTEETKWGPYLSDGQASVDWEKMEAVMLVLGHNMHAFCRQTHGMFPKVWSVPFGGIAPNSYVDDGRFNKDKKEERVFTGWEGMAEEVRRPLPKGFEDPYNITGTWTRVVCFLDFHDLFAYNFTTGQPEPDQARPALNTTEAIRLITMEIRATKSEPPGPEDGQALPIYHFEGISTSSMNTSWDPNANSSIRGTVRLTKEGEVRWQTISVFAGEERWASEGIQVGGIRSGRGVLGHWFDKDHDIHGPAGPTAFWKVSDGFREPSDDDADHPHAMYHQTTANVQYDDDEDEEDEEAEGGEEGQEHVYELGTVAESDLVTELQLGGQTASQLHDVLAQIVMGHLQQHHHYQHHPIQGQGDDEDEEG